LAVVVVVVGPTEVVVVVGSIVVVVPGVVVEVVVTGGFDVVVVVEADKQTLLTSSQTWLAGQGLPLLEQESSTSLHDSVPVQNNPSSEQFGIPD
jgi:hypothetical protein